MNVVIKGISICLFGTLVMSVAIFGINNRVFAGVETGVDIGKKAASFKLLSVEGKEYNLESFAKDKVTLLVFSTTWCPACRHEIPIIMEYYNELEKDGLKILNVNIQESKKKVKSFVEKNRINYPVALDSQAEVARLYKVVGIPLNIVMDKNRVIRFKENAPPGKELLEDLLKQQYGK